MDREWSGGVSYSCHASKVGESARAYEKGRREGLQFDNKRTTRFSRWYVGRRHHHLPKQRLCFCFVRVNAGGGWTNTKAHSVLIASRCLPSFLPSLLLSSLNNPPTSFDTFPLINSVCAQNERIHFLTLSPPPPSALPPNPSSYSPLSRSVGIWE